MDRQEFFERFSRQTPQPLERGFCEVDGKKYYCLTEDGFFRHAFVNCDSYTYYLFLKAVYEVAESINEKAVKPEFVNVKCKNGYLKGDILLEDFSKGEKKIEVVSEGQEEEELSFFENITFADQMEQFKQLSQVCQNLQIYQAFLKHFLFHLYFGDVDFHFENIEVFKTLENTTRVSPMFDFSGIYFLDTNGDANKKGFYHNQMHFSPDFLKEDFVEYYLASSGEEITAEEIDQEFLLKPNVMAKNKIVFGGVSSKENLRKLVLKAYKELEDKDFVEKLISIDFDQILSDEIYNEKFKSLFKAGTAKNQLFLAETYEKYKNTNDY